MVKPHRIAFALTALVVTSSPVVARAAPPAEPPYGPPPPPDYQATVETTTGPVTHAAVVPRDAPRPRAPRLGPAESPTPAKEKAPPPARCADESELAALRAEVAALRGELPDAVQLARLRDERRDAEAKLATLDHAVEDGVDPALLEAPRAELRTRLETLDREIASAPLPSGLRGVEASLQTVEGSLMALRLDLKSRIPTPDTAVPSPRSAPSTTGDTTTSENGDTPAAAEPIGLNVDLALASMYANRGYNIFRASSQLDTHVLVAPSVSYTHASGFSASYWGAYQANGSNREHNVKAGIGHEQDVTLAFTREVVPSFKVGGGLLGVAYPFAEKSVAGTDVPLYLEPFTTVGWSTAVDLSFYGSFCGGVQDVISSASYAYLRPGVGKTFDVAPSLQLGVGGAFGVKVPTDPAAMPSNRVDVQLDAKVVLHPTDTAYVTPAVHYGWTDIADVPTSAEHMVWASINTGVDL